MAFLCFLVLGLAPNASAAGSGFFSPTGSMSVPRHGAAAAPLRDGRVLVAGGYDSGRALSSAEIFAAGSAPASATWKGPAALSAPPGVTCNGKQATIVGAEGADLDE